MVGAGREAKRRRKTLGNYTNDASIDLLVRKHGSYSVLLFAIETEAGEKAAKEEAVVENTTPDYAAGLVSAQVAFIFTTDTYWYLFYVIFIV